MGADAATWPEVSIVFVTYGTGSVVVDAVRAAADALDQIELDGEIIVVDNEHPERGHTTADRLVVANVARADVRVVRSPANLGFGGGCDLGADLARGDVILLTNPDAFLTGDALARLVAAAERQPDQIVAPVFVTPDRTHREFGRRVDRRAITTALDAPADTLPDGARFDYASAACWAIHRSLYRRLGGFDPLYHPAYFEDVDLAFRAERAGGGTLVLDDVEVVHVGGGSVDGPTDASRQGAILRERWPRRLSR